MVYTEEGNYTKSYTVGYTKGGSYTKRFTILDSNGGSYIKKLQGESYIQRETLLALRGAIHPPTVSPTSKVIISGGKLARLTFTEWVIQ